MFISNQEKQNIHSNMLELHADLMKLRTEVLFLTAKIKALEERKAPTEKKKLTEEELKVELKKARQRAYGRTYYQRKKEREQVLHVGS
jgi:hypothetical protein